MLTRKALIHGALASGGATGGAGGAAPTGCEETIGTNHGHALEVTQDDVTAGIDKTYDTVICP